MDIEMETIKTADKRYVRLYGYRPKSVTACSGCSVGCTCKPAVSLTIALVRRQSWR